MEIPLFRILLFSTLFTFTSYFHAQNNNLEVRRIEYLHSLKKHVDKAWPEFSSQKYAADIALFTPTSTFITGRPISKTLKKSPKQTYKKGSLLIEETQRLDTDEFHMATAYESTDSSKLWYQYPVVLCSDFESTRQHIEEVSDTQTWATVILHEYFHGFQFRHPEFIRFANDSITLSITKLQSYYERYPWFRESIEQENQLLLECLSKNRLPQIKALFAQYALKRSQRLLRFSQEEKFDLTHQEEFMEKMEGSARYIEYQLYLAFKNIPVDKELAETDRYYDPSLLKAFKLEDKPWMYQSSSVRYFYSTGFNMLRLLDHLKIPYKENFFDDNSNTPYRVLHYKLLDAQ
ncbi:hypothetical protein [Chryseobacterium pennipullorum]|nr:hypothetical protein [Chryseobacterium pennipullorum]